MIGRSLVKMPDLLENFEVNREPRWPVLLRLITASLVLHVVLLSLVMYVPALRDTLNIASLLANTRFVDKQYNRTEIGDEVQLVQLTNEKFHYL